MNAEAIVRAGHRFLELREVAAVSEHAVWGGSLVTLTGGLKLHVGGVEPASLAGSMEASIVRYAPATAVLLRRGGAR